MRLRWSCVVLLGLVAGSALADDVEGTYMIPASDTLSAPLELGTTKARFRKRGATGAEIVYEMPREIDGADPQRFVLRGEIVDGEYLLKGSGATGRCPLANQEGGCRIEYVGLVLQEEAADEYVASLGSSAEQVELMKTARASLARQGVGILRPRVQQ